VSWSDAAFRVIAIAAIVSWIWRFVRDAYFGRRPRNRRTHDYRRRSDFDPCERSPDWRTTNPPWRHR
jgi:hypothetical protein